MDLKNLKKCTRRNFKKTQYLLFGDESISQTATLKNLTHGPSNLQNLFYWFNTNQRTPIRVSKQINETIRSLPYVPNAPKFFLKHPLLM